MDTSDFFPISFNPKAVGDRSIYTRQMQQNEATMRQFAGSNRCREVIEGRSHTFDAYTFLTNLPIKMYPGWQISWHDVIALRRDDKFVKAHIQTMVYWLNACGFSARSCRFFDWSRVDRSSQELKDHPRIARFMHCVNLFADLGGNIDQPSPAVMDAYIALEKATGAFIIELGLHGKFTEDGATLAYKTPGSFLTNAGILSPEQGRDYEARIAQHPIGPLDLDDFAKHASDLQKYAPDEIGDDEPDHPVSSPEADSTEGTIWSRWLVVGTIGMLCLGLILLTRVVRRGRFL